MEERESCSYEPLWHAVRRQFQGEDDVHIFCWKAPRKCEPLIFVQDRQVSIQQLDENHWPLTLTMCAYGKRRQ